MPLEEETGMDCTRDEKTIQCVLGVVKVGKGVPFCRL